MKRTIFIIAVALLIAIQSCNPEIKKETETETDELKLENIKNCNWQNFKVELKFSNGEYLDMTGSYLDYPCDTTFLFISDSLLTITGDCGQEVDTFNYIYNSDLKKLTLFKNNEQTNREYQLISLENNILVIHFVLDCGSDGIIVWRYSYKKKK